MPTFRAFINNVDTSPLRDGLFALVNTNPKAVVTVREVRLFPGAGTNSNLLPAAAATAFCLPAPGNWTLSRISAVIGGSAVSATKYDTASTSLPAQVQFLEMPDGATQVEDLLLRPDYPGPFKYSGANPPPDDSTRFQNISGGSRPSGTINLAGLMISRFGQTESIVLREGEGVALFQTVYSVPHAGTIGVEVVNLASGATYRYFSREVGSPRRLDSPIWALMNGSGSGVDLRVTRIESIGDGDVALNTTSSGSAIRSGFGVRLILCDGVAGDAPAVSAISHDTAYALPAGVSVHSSPFRAVWFGEGSGSVPIDWWFNLGSRWTPGMAIAASNHIFWYRGQRAVGTLRNRTYPFPARNESFPNAPMGDDTLLFKGAIVVREGKALAIVGGTDSCSDVGHAFLYGDIEVTFDVSLDQSAQPIRYVS